MAAQVGRGRGARGGLRVALIGGLTTLAACFSPGKPPCAFTCVSASHLCPDDYTCGADGLCHRAGAEDTCALTSPYGEGGAGGTAGAAGGTAGAAGGAAGAAGGATGALGGATGAGGQASGGAGAGGA